MNYQDMIDKLKMSQRAAAAFLKIDERTSRRYAADELPLPPSIRYLLSLMIKKRISPEEARKTADKHFFQELPPTIPYLLALMIKHRITPDEVRKIAARLDLNE